MNFAFGGIIISIQSRHRGAARLRWTHGPVPLNLSGNSVVGSALHLLLNCKSAAARGLPHFFIYERMHTMANHINSGYRNTHTLVECAMLLAISAVLAFFPTFELMPNGGSVTICSMLPIILISYRHGLKWGFLSSFAFSLIQLIEEFMSNGADIFSLIVALLFDYIVAFTVLGIGGIFRGKLKSTRAELVSGTVLALLLRYASHCVSGYVVWGEYAEWFFSEAGAWGQNILTTFAGKGLMLVYSLIYNATYMLPELVITVIGAALLAGTSVLKEERS